MWPSAKSRGEDQLHGVAWPMQRKERPPQPVNSDELGASSSSSSYPTSIPISVCDLLSVNRHSQSPLQTHMVQHKTSNSWPYVIHQKKYTFWPKCWRSVLPALFGCMTWKWCDRSNTCWRIRKFRATQNRRWVESIPQSVTARPFIHLCPYSGWSLKWWCCSPGHIILNCLSNKSPSNALVTLKVKHQTM